MTFPGPPPEAGWYNNANGQQQWWDGSAWGPVAPGQPVTPLAAPIVHQVAATPVKTRTASYWLAILLGGFGAHRFYLRHFGTAWMLLAASVVSVGFRIDPHPTSAIVANVLLAFVWLWVIVDLFTIPGMVDDVNRKIAQGISQR